MVSIQWNKCCYCLRDWSHCLLLEAQPQLASNGTSGDVSTIDEVKDWIMQSVQPRDGQSDHDDDYGYGLLDIDALLELAEQQSTA